MQPPQNPYDQPPQQPSYPQQQQQPYGQPPQGYRQEGYGPQGYRPANGYYGAKPAGGLDILMGIILLLLSLGGFGIGVLMLIGAAALSSGALNSSSSPSFANLPAGTTTMAFVLGGVFVAWTILMFICSIGIFKLKKWALIITAIQGLASAGYYGYRLAMGSRGAAGTDAGNAALVITLVFIVLGLIYTIYGFARAGSAN